MKDLIIVRGGGDIATGTIYKLVKSGFHVLILEIAHPSAIRRNVAFSEAVYEEKWQVEDMTCHLAHDIKEAEQIMKAGNPALMIDPNGEMIKQLHPIAVVDAILAKKNLGTTRDMAPITIGEGSNIQDNAVVHVDNGFPTVIGNGVTIGHGAIVHGCTVEDDCIIGMGAVLLNGARIGKNCIIGAGTLVPEGKEVPEGSVAFGNPVRVYRPVNEEDIKHIHANAAEYVEYAGEGEGEYN